MCSVCLHIGYLRIWLDKSPHFLVFSLVVLIVTEPLLSNEIPKVRSKINNNMVLDSHLFPTYNYEISLEIIKKLNYEQDQCKDFDVQ